MACKSCGKKRAAKVAKDNSAKIAKLKNTIPAKPTARVTPTAATEPATPKMVLESQETTHLTSNLKLSKEALTEKMHKINEQKRKNYIRQKRTHLIYKARYGDAKLNIKSPLDKPESK